MHVENGKKSLCRNNMLLTFQRAFIEIFFFSYMS